MITPGLWQMQLLFALVGFNPDALHLWFHFTATIFAHPTTRTIAQGFGTGHRADHPRRVQDTLPAHLATPDRFLYCILEER